ncbi:hypothetical protein [Rhizobium leguminosarum]|uniref:hypothetical protein n=1 Tax=Rhizobium leguminosarum TaxID=384 RepID=UPI00143F88A7|nr:hypothetical protein [Rhizobium leguminosarum]NKL04416.1 hypothetical protein [Rhizobium leguminosarum bv. viciae]NKL82852.1 hypothetical protein [Rhizobium leguminosarum bv. viciae]NKL89580.1 hypothetical protein [Rhizobium leguminosarum bv. viciae]NKM90547.1 hypothetical protein [Rhizobium leguminosarum bv. viciae]
MLFYGIAPATLFFVVSYSTDQIMPVLFSYIKTNATQYLVADKQEALNELLNGISPNVYPLLVLIGGLVFFAPVLRKPFVWMAQLFLRVAGTRARTDGLAREAAHKIIKQHSNNNDIIERSINENVCVIPLPQEFLSAPYRDQLAYKLLYIRDANFHDSRPQVSFKEIGRELGVSITFDDGGDIRPNIYFVPALLFYIVLCFMYTLFIPKAYVFTHWGITRFIQPILWPEPSVNGINSDLALSIVKSTFSFVGPLAIGFYLFSIRRTTFLREPVINTFSVIASFQFLIAVSVNTAFALLYIVFWKAGLRGGSPPSLFNVTTWLEIIMYSLTPVAALGAALFMSTRKASAIKYVSVLCFVSAFAFYFSQLSYEYYRQPVGYYWHQFVMGLFLAVSYVLAALLVRDASLVFIQLMPPSTSEEKAEEAVAPSFDL